MTDEEHNAQVLAISLDMAAFHTAIRAKHGDTSYPNLVIAHAQMMGRMLAKMPTRTVISVLSMLVDMAGLKAEMAVVPPEAMQSFGGTVTAPDLRRSGALPRSTQRSSVIAHTLTDTEYRYGKREKDAQMVRDLYRGQGHKRVDVYSPEGDLLQTVEVEP